MNDSIKIIMNTTKYQAMMQYMHKIELIEPSVAKLNIELIAVEHSHKFNTYIEDRTICLNPTLFIDDKVTTPMLVFTICHEIGHYVLKHLTSDIDGTTDLVEQELEADAFAIKALDHLRINRSCAVKMLTLLNVSYLERRIENIKNLMIS